MIKVPTDEQVREVDRISKKLDIFFPQCDKDFTYDKYKTFIEAYGIAAHEIRAWNKAEWWDINMNKYMVVYTLSTEVEADSVDEALAIAAEIPLDKFDFIDAEVEKYRG